MFKGLYLNDSGFASCPNPNVTSDLTVVVELWKENWIEGSNESLASVFETSGDQRSWDVKVSSDGKLQFIWSTDGAAVETSESVVTVDSLVSAARESIALKIELDVDPGTVTMYWAPSRSETFTQFFQESVGITSLFSSSADLLAGSAELNNSVIRALEVYSGISTSIQVNAQFENEARGTTSFTDDTANDWDLDSNAVIIDGQTPNLGLWVPSSTEEAAEWAVADTPGNLAQANAEAIDTFIGSSELDSQQAIIDNSNNEGPFTIGSGGVRRVFWKEDNGLVFANWDIIFGSSHNIPALGFIEFELPVAADMTFHKGTSVQGVGDILGEAQLYDTHVSGRQLASVQLLSGSEVRVILEGGNSQRTLTGDDPWVPAEGDSWNLSAVYKAA